MAETIIRKMEIADIEQVMKVEEASFDSPWTKEMFYQELSENNHAHYLVLQMDKEVIGYVGLWIVLDDAQVTNIAIMPDYRGKGLGKMLFQYTLHYVINLGVKRLSLEVRVSNIVAQRMYRRFGLVPGGIRKNYYKDNQEDALVMWVNLNES
nr:ribosomal protein S18-alanine N-acetyltransferase [Oceanobacillus halotolerans]